MRPFVYLASLGVFVVAVPIVAQESERFEQFVVIPKLKIAKGTVCELPGDEDSVVKRIAIRGYVPGPREWGRETKLLARRTRQSIGLPDKKTGGRENVPVYEYVEKGSLAELKALASMADNAVPQSKRLFQALKTAGRISKVGIGSHDGSLSYESQIYALFSAAGWDRGEILADVVARVVKPLQKKYPKNLINLYPSKSPTMSEILSIVGKPDGDLDEITQKLQYGWCTFKFQDGELDSIELDFSPR